MHRSRTAIGQVLVGFAAAVVGWLIAIALRRQPSASPSEIVNETTMSYVDKFVRGEVVASGGGSIELAPNEDEDYCRILVLVPLGRPDLEARLLEGFLAATDDTDALVIRSAEDYHHTYEVFYPDHPSTMPDLAAVAIAIGTLTDKYYDKSGDLYRLPGQVSVTIGSPIGEITFRTSMGYFGGSGVFIYTPNQVPLAAEIVKAFHAATNDEFLIQDVPSSSSGGDSRATHLLSAGTGMERYGAHVKDNSVGYFKASDAPRLPIVVRLVAQAIEGYVETYCAN